MKLPTLGLIATLCMPAISFADNDSCDGKLCTCPQIVEQINSEGRQIFCDDITYFINVKDFGYRIYEQSEYKSDDTSKDDQVEQCSNDKSGKLIEKANANSHVPQPTNPNEVTPQLAPGISFELSKDNADSSLCVFKLKYCNPKDNNEPCETVDNIMLSYTPPID